MMGKDEIKKETVNEKRVIYVGSEVSGKVLAKAIHEQEMQSLRAKWEPVVNETLHHKK